MDLPPFLPPKAEETEAAIGWLGGGGWEHKEGWGHPYVLSPPPFPISTLVHSGFFLARPGSFAWTLAMRALVCSRAMPT